MDIVYLIGRLESLVTSSRKIPLLNRVLLKESEVLSVLDEMRNAIPEEVKQARRVLQDRERTLAQAQEEASARVAQAQKEADALVMRARTEAERLISQQGLLRAAEERSQELVRQATQHAQGLTRQAQEHNEQMKVEADAYVIETLQNLREHISSLEMEMSQSILSIDKGLESMQGQQTEGYEQEGEGEEAIDDGGQWQDEDLPPPEASAPPGARRASLASDTMGMS